MLDGLRGAVGEGAHSIKEKSNHELSFALSVKNA